MKTQFGSTPDPAAASLIPEGAKEATRKHDHAVDRALVDLLQRDGCALDWFEDDVEILWDDGFGVRESWCGWGYCGWYG